MPTTMEKPQLKRVTHPGNRGSTKRSPVKGNTQVRRQQSRGLDKPARYQPNHRSDAKTQPQPLRRRRTIAQHDRETHVPRTVRPRVRKQQSKVQGFFQSFSLEKGFTLIGLAVGVVLAILFAIDLIFAWPFMKASVAFDVTFMLSGLAMVALSLNVANDQSRGHCRPPSSIGPSLFRSL